MSTVQFKEAQFSNQSLLKTIHFLFYEITVKSSASLAHECNQVGHGFMNRAAKHPRVQVSVTALNL